MPQTHLEPTTDELHHALRHGVYAEKWRAAQTLWRLEGSRVIEVLLHVLQEPAPGSGDREDANADGTVAKADEYTLFDALFRQDFQAAWHMAQDLAQMNTDYAFIVFERVLELTSESPS